MTNRTSTGDKTISALANHAFLVGLTLRLFLMIVLPILMDDGLLLQGVKYTDIDYDVFTDAAEHVSNGRSPFRRHTYRYTPFIAWILSFASSNDGMKGASVMTWWKHPKYFGKILFCIADSLCGLIIMKLKQSSRKYTTNASDGTNINTKIQDALWWMYNPLPINICTRGSGESFVVLLPVLFTLITVMSTSNCRKRYQIWFVSIVAGMIHGLAIHAKLYPIIYTVSFMAYISLQEQSLQTKNKTKKSISTIGWYSVMKPLTDDDTENSRIQHPFPWLDPIRLQKLIRLWIQRLLLTLSSLLFLIFSMTTFAALTYVAVKMYGDESLQEGLLYHFSRLDHRHNYSMFWYWIYLARGKVSHLGGDMSSSSLTIMSKGLLLPQVVLLLYSSLGIAPYDLSFALFLQTFSFVAQNKVMTAQYFTWYLVLLPLCSDRIIWRTRSMIQAATFLGLSIVTWLGCAFCLEMKGMALHLQVWMASVGFFVANVNLLRVIVLHYCGFGSTAKQHKKLN